MEKNYGGILYLYNFHNFEEVVKFDLAEELKKGKKVYDIPSLFSVKIHMAYASPGTHTTAWGKPT